MTFSIDNPRGGCNNPPLLGKYVWEKPSGEQGLITADHAATKQSPDHGARRSNTQQPLRIRKVQRNTDKLKMVQQDLGL